MKTINSVTLMQGDVEFPVETLIQKIFDKLKDAPDSLTEEDKELFAAAARMGMVFLSEFEEFADPIKAMLYISPQMASYMMAMFTGGMYAHRALVNPNNNLTIVIEEVEEPDNSDQCSSTEGCSDTGGNGCNASPGSDPSGHSCGESMGSSPGTDGEE